MPQKDVEQRRTYHREYHRRNRDRLNAAASARYRAKTATMVLDRGGRDHLGRYVRGHNGKRRGVWEKSTTRHATVTPTIRRLAWAAGFLEGEGHFEWNRTSGRVDATQVQLEPLERILALFGGNIKAQRPRENQQPHWRWWVCGSRARGVMLTLYPMMSPRRQGQIRKALGQFSKAG